VLSGLQRRLVPQELSWLSQVLLMLQLQLWSLPEQIVHREHLQRLRRREQVHLLQEMQQMEPFALPCEQIREALRSQSCGTIQAFE
jgi:hypothetical protein